MIRTIPGLPDAVLGFEAVGEVHSDDYRTVMDPAVEAATKSADKLRLLYVLGRDFEGYSAGAAGEDAKVGIGHWASWERIAVVTDTGWVADGIKAFGWMVPGQVKVFGVDRLEAAKAWVSE